MGRQHQNQHRAVKESKETELKESNQALRAQLQKLRRENARLRREYEKLVAHVIIEEEMTPAVAAPPTVKGVVINPDDMCPGGCRTPLKTVALNGKVLAVCPECKWRTVRSTS